MHISKHIVRFSSFILLLTSVTSCAYIIPEDLNAPRNNEVIGDRRVPERNIGKTTIKKPDAPSPQSMAEPAEPTRMAMVQPTQPPRLVPIENGQFQLSAAGYPTLSDMPPRPVTTGPDSAPARLNDTKTMLERDRAQANDSANALARDAAAEPSMLSDLPKTDGAMPAQEPANGSAKPTNPPRVTVPAAPTQQQYIQPQSSAPAAKPQASSGPLVLPPPPMLYPVEPVTYSPKTAAVTASQPVITSAPIMAAPQQVASVTQAPSQPVQVASIALPSPPMPRVIPGDFDPLVMADATRVPTVSPAPIPAVVAAPAAPSNASRYGIPSRYYQ